MADKAPQESESALGDAPPSTERSLQEEPVRSGEQGPKGKKQKGKKGKPAGVQPVESAPVMAICLTPKPAPTPTPAAARSAVVAPPGAQPSAAAASQRSPVLASGSGPASELPAAGQLPAAAQQLPGTAPAVRPPVAKVKLVRAEGTQCEQCKTAEAGMQAKSETRNLAVGPELVPAVVSIGTQTDPESSPPNTSWKKGPSLALLALLTAMGRWSGPLKVPGSKSEVEGPTSPSAPASPPAPVSPPISDWRRIASRSPRGAPGGLGQYFSPAVRRLEEIETDPQATPAGATTEAAKTQRDWWQAVVRPKPTVAASAVPAAAEPAGEGMVAVKPAAAEPTAAERTLTPVLSPAAAWLAGAWPAAAEATPAMRERWARDQPAGPPARPAVPVLSGIQPYNLLRGIAGDPGPVSPPQLRRWVSLYGMDQPSGVWVAKSERVPPRGTKMSATLVRLAASVDTPAAAVVGTGEQMGPASYTTRAGLLYRISDAFEPVPVPCDLPLDETSMLDNAFAAVSSTAAAVSATALGFLGRFGSGESKKPAVQSSVPQPVHPGSAHSNGKASLFVCC